VKSHPVKLPARQLTKARGLLKADASEAGEGWSDCQIEADLDTSVDKGARTSQQPMDEGLRRFWSASTHQPRPESASLTEPPKPN
jgi:hypothetical protein